MFCFSIVRGLANAYHELEFEKDLSSNRYIHPSTFRRSAFWKHVLGNFGLLVLSLALLGGVLYGLIGFVVPIAVIYGRTFLLSVSVVHVGGLVIGLAVLYVGLLALDIALRFLLFHARLLNN